MNKILKYQGAGKLISLLDDIVKAAKSSPIDFSDWGKLHRSDMLKIPGNKSIVSKLSDSELGYLLYNRNGQILNGTGSRYAIFTGSDPMSVKRINIFDSPGRNTGYLIPEYDDVVPGTVSTHYVENLTGGVSKGISEDSYNALMNITGKPLSANRIWKMPEITEKVYKKFTPGIPNPQFKMMQHKLIDQVGSSGKPAGWSSQKWQEELEWMKKRADIDAGIQDGDELFNTVDDFYEDVMRTPIEAIRPVIQGPTRFVPTKHEFLFQINPQTIKNGTPVVNWSDPNIWLKNGGRIAKYQGAGWIGKGIKWLFTKGDDIAKYTSGVKKRAAEAVIRTGDAAESIYGLAQQMTSPKTIKYIFNPKRSELAYQLPYRYSGLTANASDARPGDVVDIFLGKTTVPNDIAFKDLPLEIQSYLSKNYPGRKIITKRLGNTQQNWIPSINSKDYGQASLLSGQSKKLRGDFNSSGVIINGASVLDPGGYNVYATRLGDDLILDSYDVWKFKPADYGKQYGTNIRGIGLKFIDSQGNPIVSTWQHRIPNYFSQELKLKPFEPYIPTLRDKLQKHWDRYFKPIVGIGAVSGLVYGAKKAAEQIE